MDFKTSIEDIDAVTKQITVSIPANDVEQNISVEIEDLSKKVRLKGFRPGKAPKNLVEKLHGGRVRMEVAHRLISDSLRNLISENKFDIVGEPEIDISSFEPGQQMEYKATVYLFPKPTVAGYDKFEVEVNKRIVDDGMVDETLDRIRKSHVTVGPLSGGRSDLRDGDVLEGTLQLTVEGEEPQPEEPLVVGLGEGALPKELEEGLIGAVAGDTREVPTTIPADHPKQAWRGKSAKYRVSIKDIKEKVLPEVTDDFAKKTGLEVETVLELKIRIREELEKESDRNAQSDVHAAILDQIGERNSFAVPKIMVDDEIRSMLVRSGILNPEKYDISKIPVDSFRDQLSADAEKRVRIAIIVDRIAEQESLSLSEEEKAQAMQKIAEENGLPLDDVTKFFSQNPERAANFALEQTRNKVLEMLVERTKIQYKEVTQEELEKQAKEAAAPSN